MEPTASVPAPRSISRQRAQPLPLAYATDGVQQREMLAADPAGHLQRHRRLARCEEVGSAGRGAWRRGGAGQGETDAAGRYDGRWGRAEVRGRSASPLPTSRRGRRRRSRAGKAAIGRQDRRRGYFANKLDRVCT
ncbi:hypothetical protein GQ55_1G043500 [Panicum hallii var. hallii]|uniref:Uncharacterized protein n=1 Tax=Panicum hallii var. hallii TaxID=1504633 RepID=A0A2T7F246_9POAL|nr:hypothetical protein GQ55_1G043500 [Panicum hallii var. hallii]